MSRPRSLVATAAVMLVALLQFAAPASAETLSI